MKLTDHVGSDWLSDQLKQLRVVHELGKEGSRMAAGHGWGSSFVGVAHVEVQ